jgi:uncharacterized protein involved in exopolysaccharide biosynthesis
VIVAGVAIGVVVGAISLHKPRTYTSTASFVPQAVNTDGSAMAGVAASFGLNVGGAGQTDSPQFYADLLTSDEILRPVATASYPSPVSLNGGSVPLSKILKLDEPDPETRIFKLEKTLRGMMEVNVNIRTGIIAVTITTAYPTLSRQLADTLLASVNAFNLAGRQSRAASDREFAEGRVESYQAELMSSERAYEEFLRSNRVINSPGLELQRDRYQRKIAMLQQVVTSLTQTYEQARIDEVRGTPVIRVLQRPRVPVEPNARGTIRKVFLGALVGSLLALVVAAAMERMRYAQAVGDPALTEFLSYFRSIFRRRVA